MGEKPQSSQKQDAPLNALQHLLPLAEQAVEKSHDGEAARQALGDAVIEAGWCPLAARQRLPRQRRTRYSTPRKGLYTWSYAALGVVTKESWFSRAAGSTFKNDHNPPSRQWALAVLLTLRRIQDLETSFGAGKVTPEMLKKS